MATAARLSLLALLASASGCATTNGEPARLGPPRAESAAAVACAGPADPTHELAPARSSIDVAGADRLTGEHVGKIRVMSGRLASSPDGVPTALFLEVDLKSLTMDSARVEEFVKSHRFLGVDTWPVASFVTCRIAPSGEPGELVVSGVLTLHGVSRRVEHRARLTRRGDLVILNASYRLPRRDFGIQSGGLVDSVISPHFRIGLSLAFARPKAEIAQPAKRSVADTSSWSMPGSKAE